MKHKNMVFGIRPVLEILNSNKPISKILVNRNYKSETIKNIVQCAKEKKVTIIKVPKEKLDQVTKKEHQGVIAYISPIYYCDLNYIIQDRYNKTQNPCILILDHITDTRNMGSIIRSAACFGIHCIVTPIKGSAPINEITMKSSSGALIHVPICRENNLLKTVDFVQKCGLKVFSLTQNAKKNISEVDLNIPRAFILGNEERGISDDLLEKCDTKIKIPIQGPINSLNVAVAASIACYESSRV